MIADRVLLAFETDQGRAYVQASGWQRTYLMWTFRNFRGVPHKILNARQRQMVESLYLAAANPGHEVDEDTVIGTVEDFVPPFPAPVSVSRTQMPAASVPARQAARESAPATIHEHPGRLAFPGLARAVATGLVIVITAGVTWQQMRTRPVVSASAAEPVSQLSHSASPAEDKDRTPAIAPVTSPTSTNLTSTSSTSTKSGSQPLPEAQLASAAPAALDPVPAASHSEPAARELTLAVRNVEPGPGKRGTVHNAISPNHSASGPAALQDAFSLQPRMKISGPPQKLVYPVCPDGSTRGKVSLQAVVGYDGTVSQVRVLGGNRLLAAAAKRAIREWRYQPFSADAQRLEREARITVSFISEDVVAVSFPDAAPVSR